MSRSTEPVVLINLFEVPPEADAPFVAGWERARDSLEAKQGYIDTALHRSLSPDARFRFVNVASWESPEAFQAAVADPKFPGRDAPFPSYPALYSPISGNESEEDGSTGSVLINPFEVPVASDDEFIAGWMRARDFLSQRPGYVRTRLHRSLSPEAKFRFVNIAIWETPQSFEAATQDPEFGSVARTPYPAYPALYEIIRR
jgi:heme oxygenase (mycobilin-producing)